TVKSVEPGDLSILVLSEEQCGASRNFWDARDVKQSVPPGREKISTIDLIHDSFRSTTRKWLFPYAFLLGPFCIKEEPPIWRLNTEPCLFGDYPLHLLHFGIVRSPKLALILRSLANV